jgi:uncharacterized cupin superfamily protein
MTKIDPTVLAPTLGSGYPAPFDEPCRLRQRWRLGHQGGLTQFGVNLLKLPPGAWSSQRHWHSAEDEFVYVLEGEVVLVSGSGEQVLRRGECAAFKAGEADGHHVQNRSDAEALLLEVGTHDPQRDAVEYPDIDLKLNPGDRRYAHKDGMPYPPPAR